MAKKMGYKNFIELGYYRMTRICFDQKDVEIFRENVYRDVVPVIAKLRTENAKRLGIDKMMFYDNDVIVPGGDPVPCGKEDIFKAAKEMYHSMGKETGDFIDMMLEADAFDVDARKNKWGGWDELPYCCKDGYLYDKYETKSYSKVDIRCGCPKGHEKECEKQREYLENPEKALEELKKLITQEQMKKVGDSLNKAIEKVKENEKQAK